MKHIYHIIITLIISIIFVGCQDSDFAETKMNTPIVIEGVIEEGELPVVTVTRALDLSGEEINTDNFVEKWSRVTINDITEDKSYILTGRIDTTRMVNFIFRHEKLRGVAGHTYLLKVETEDETYLSTTMIREGASLTRLKSESVAGDSLFTITAYISNLKPDCYYKLVAKTDSDLQYCGTFRGVFKGEEYDEERGYVVSRGIRSAYYDKDLTEQFSHYFKKGERVSVKLCEIDKEIYDFWVQYDNTVSLSSNMFFTFQENLTGNIQGALGYWAGYSSSVNHIIIRGNL